MKNKLDAFNKDKIKCKKCKEYYEYLSDEHFLLCGKCYKEWKFYINHKREARVPTPEDLLLKDVFKICTATVRHELICFEEFLNEQ
jgi:hypothetical protein